jgi:pyruvate/2-oxoglutarate dehydrogenase complex dihydrolipoamide dehydrogenase (E3) component
VRLAPSASASSRTATTSRRRRLHVRRRRRSSARTCCWRSGRRPNTDDLGLDKAGVETDARGYIVVDDELRTNAPGIWALGDCNGKRRLHPHRLQRLRDRRGQPARRRSAPRQRPHHRLRALHRSAARPRRHDRGRGAGRRAPLLVGMRPMTRVGRAIEKGETQGFMKVVVDAETRSDPRRRDPRASAATRRSTASST